MLYTCESPFPHNALIVDGTYKQDQLEINIKRCITCNSIPGTCLPNACLIFSRPHLSLVSMAVSGVDEEIRAQFALCGGRSLCQVKELIIAELVDGV